MPGMPAQLIFQLDDLGQMRQKPGIDVSQRVDFVDRHAAFEGVAQIPHPLVVGTREFGPDFFSRGLLRRAPAVLVIAAETETADFQPAQRLLKRFFERAADGHRFADAFHLRGQGGIGLGEFFEGEPRDLGHHVIDRRLEAGHRFAGDVVGQFVQPVADGQLGGDLGDGETRGLAASALERLTRGFISMTIIRPFLGLIANWMFEPPVSTPISRITASDASRIRWYSLSVSVWAGATVIESPV